MSKTKKKPVKGKAQNVEASATGELSRFAARLKYENIPKGVVHQAKRVIMDTIGCTVAGFSIDPGKMVIHVIRELGGNPEATIIPTGDRTSMANAAYVNCELSNVLDMDDSFLAHGHIANCTVMAPLAAAEKMNGSGKDLITAVVAGFEVAARICSSLGKTGRVVSPPPDIKIEYSQVTGGGWNIFGAVAGVGNALKLSENEMLHALGIGGYCSPIPGFSKISENKMPLFKYCPYGSIGWESVVACMLARQGMEGVTNILDGERGYWRMVSSDYCDWDVLRGGLGEKWWIMDTHFKEYPACSRNKPAIFCMRKIIDKHGIKADEIESITVRTIPYMVTPIFCIAEPETAAESFSSYPWNMAMLALGVPGDQWGLKATLEDPGAKALARKVKVDVEPRAMQSVYEQLIESHEGVKAVRAVPTTVEVSARGKVFSQYEEYGRGDPSTPETTLSDEELAMKFRTHARELLPGNRSEKAIEMLMDLDRLDDVGKLLPFLVM